MKTWEEMIKTLPSDETLEKLEKNGEIKVFDRKLNLLEKEIKNLKHKMKKDNREIDKMFEDVDISKNNKNKTK